MDALPYVVAAWVMVVGLYGIVTSRNLIHLVICLSVVQSPPLLRLRGGGTPPAGAPRVAPPRPPRTGALDPVVQALTLTDVVVGTTVTAMLLAIAVQAYKRYGSLDPDELRTMRG